MTRPQIQACLLLASMLACSTIAFPAVPARRRAEARAAYDLAVRLRAGIESQPESARKKSDYEKLVRAFREVYRLDPAYSKTPAALAALAEVYEQMGQLFSSDRYYLESVKAYEFVSTQYPKSKVARDGLFAAGEIYRTDLEDPAEARKIFQQFIAEYPRSAKADQAREKLKDLDQAEKAALPAKPAPPPPSRFPAEKRPAGGTPEVTAIRRWVGPNYTRIVIGLEGEAKFDTTRLMNPDRIVLDLANTRLSPSLASKVFPAEDAYLRQIRVAQFKPTVTRVVLDVVKIEDYSVFTLPNPFRLIIDIHGAAPPARAENAKPPKPPAAVAEAPASRTRTAKEVAKESGTPGVESKSDARKAPAASETDTTEVASAKPPAPAPRSGARSGARSGDPGSGEAAASVRTASPTESGARTLTRALGLKIGRVVIDPGHGGHDTGTVGPTGLREKDVVLDVALRLKKLLTRNSAGLVILTRSDDTFIPLEERTALANERAADLFISIHANASRDRSARGVETYFLNFTSSPDALEVAARENATSQESVHELQDLIKKIAMTEKIEESQEFARLVQRQVHDSLLKAGSAQRDRGLKKAPFVVLIGANMPSILAEISFLTNPRDERLLKKPDYRQKVAEALYRGIERYVNTLGVAQVTEQARRSESPREARAHEPANHPDF